MKRLIALSLAILLAALHIVFNAASASAENEDGALGDGLYTSIPYVPEYKGELTSKTRVLLMDLETGNALIEQNGDVRAYPASTTKIMTCVLFIENTADDEWDTPLPPLTEVNSETSEKGSQFGLKIGDCPTRRDLLYGLMLPSGCDCAYVVSNLIAGSEADFVFMMNVRASEIGMNNSGYENSYGIASNGHYTTAEDMATLVRHAMQYELFRKVIATEYKTLTFYNSVSGTQRTITTRNTNHLIRHDSPDYYANAIGVKTGTGVMADHCLTSAARKSGLELIAIVMNSEGNSERYGFSKEILEWGFKFYASEGGLYSMYITNALFKAVTGGCGVYDVPESGSEGQPKAVLPAGSGVRVGAYRYDRSGNIWYMVWNDGGFDWARAEQLEFVAYVNDISIDPGKALSGVHKQGEDPELDGVIASRHLVKTVTVTVYDENGVPLTGGSNYPAASCTHTFVGTTIEQDVDLSILEPGVYTCVTKVEAVAYVPDAPEREYYISEESSVIRIAGSGDQDQVTYCFNANTGSGAPLGGAVKAGEAVTISDAIPVKPGCRFAGWNTKADGTGTNYSVGSVIKPNSSLTLYAMWEKGENAWETEIAPSFKDSRLSIDGSICNEAGVTAVKLTLDAIGEDISEPVFIDTEYCCTNEFSFEKFNEKLSGFDLANGDYRLTVSASHALSGLEELYSDIVSNRSAAMFAVTFDPNGGSIVSGEAQIEMSADEVFGTLPVAEKEDSEFVGWFDPSGSPVAVGSPLPASDSGTIVIRARWNDKQDDNTIIIHTKTGLAAVPIGVWIGGGVLLLALVIGLMIFIIKKPDRRRY